jgi:hypothetical protein
MAVRIVPAGLRRVEKGGRSMAVGIVPAPLRRVERAGRVVAVRAVLCRNAARGGS